MVVSFGDSNEPNAAKEINADDIEDVKSIAPSWHSCSPDLDHDKQDHILVDVISDAKNTCSSESSEVCDTLQIACCSASEKSKDRTINSFLMNKTYDTTFAPVTIAFENISYVIPLKNALERVVHKINKHKNMKASGASVLLNEYQSKPTSTTIDPVIEKQVLHEFSGVVEPGEVLAILGPSGCGKTSLLNLLAGRLRTGRVGGHVLYNGILYNSKMKGNVLGYVMQEDALLQNLTVRETFSYALELRYCHLPKKVRDARVQDVIDELGLKKCADSLVGGSLRRGVSGGEKKRVSIGVELLANPAVLFLDEPTSGLDSTTAKNLVETLVFLASQNRTVICTIHQPQSSIFGLFDKVLLLSQGKPMFFGPADEAVMYFSSLNFICPSYTNPSDYFLDLVSVDSRNEESQCAKRLKYLADSYKMSKYYLENESGAKLWESDSKPFDFTEYLAIDPLSFFRQFWVLLRRSFQESFRNKVTTMFRLMQSIFMAIFCGLLYFDIGSDQQSIMDRRGALFFIAIQQAMVGFLSIIGVFHAEKLVYFREHDAKMYGTSPYFFAKYVSELPISIISPLLFLGICYCMIGLQWSATLFFIGYGCLLIATLTAQALGLVVGTLSPSYDFANVISPVILGFMVIFGGLLISDDNVPVYMRWIPSVNFVKYTYEILSYNEFTGLNFTCTPEEARQSLGNKCPIPTGKDALIQVGMQDINIDFNFGIMCALFLGFSLFAYIFLRFEITRR